MIYLPNQLQNIAFSLTAVTVSVSCCRLKLVNLTSVAAVHLVLMAVSEEHRTQNFAPSCSPPELAEPIVLLRQETYPQVQRFGDPLPTFDAFKAKSAKMRSKTVQDVWGLMLTSVPGESPFL